jgi:hypothetical protein
MIQVTICSQCNAWYNSERELQYHVATAHHRFGSEQSSSEPGDKPSEVQAVPEDSAD